MNKRVRFHGQEHTAGQSFNLAFQKRCAVDNTLLLRQSRLFVSVYHVSLVADDWSGVLLNDFLGCAHNLANNRQTRMLANLSLVGCYNHNALLPAQRDAIMLRSAKANLRSMAFFGLVEYQRATQYMFERTFHMKFVNDFEQYRKTHATSAHVTDEQTEHVLRVNRLDIELYRYAKELFLQRLHKMRKEDGTLGEGEEGGVDVARSEYEEDEEYEDDDAADGH